MICAWDSFIRLLPIRFRNEVNNLGKDALQEVRLRLGLPPMLQFQNKTLTLKYNVTLEDLKQCIHFASQYSPWSAGSLNQGYITAPGGHRVGVFGRYSRHETYKWSLQTPTMICLRVARDFYGIAKAAYPLDGSILIIGPPGSGKTTLLRDLIRCYSDLNRGNISVIDEKEEIFPRDHDKLCFFPGNHTDVLSGCEKRTGIQWALRNMTPAVIAVDEITATDDCDAMLQAGWCGVYLFATAHAGSVQDLMTRPVYKPIVEHKLFQTLLVMQSNKCWHTERINI